jgi:hypothetical protein
MMGRSARKDRLAHDDPAEVGLAPVAEIIHKIRVLHFFLVLATSKRVLNFCRLQGGENVKTDVEVV